MKSLVAACLTLVACAAAFAAPEASTTWNGRAFLRTDAADRVVVVLDVDRNGSADHVFLFDPLQALPRGLAPQEADVTVELDASALRVVSKDGRIDLALRAENPPDGASPAAQAGGLVQAFGRALVHRVLGAESGSIGSIDTDPMPTVYPQGSDDPCLNPTFCRAGGKGSGSCSIDCGGRNGSMFGVGFGYTNPGCTVACNFSAGYYSCCNCDSTGGRCGCYRDAPCLLDPDRPITPTE